MFARGFLIVAREQVQVVALHENKPPASRRLQFHSAIFFLAPALHSCAADVSPNSRPDLSDRKLRCPSPKAAAQQVSYTPWPTETSIFAQVLAYASDAFEIAKKDSPDRVRQCHTGRGCCSGGAPPAFDGPRPMRADETRHCSAIASILPNLWGKHEPIPLQLALYQQRQHRDQLRQWYCPRKAGRPSAGGIPGGPLGCMVRGVPRSSLTQHDTGDVPCSGQIAQQRATQQDFPRPDVLQRLALLRRLSLIPAVVP